MTAAVVTRHHGFCGKYITPFEKITQAMFQFLPENSGNRKDGWLNWTQPGFEMLLLQVSVLHIVTLHILYRRCGLLDLGLVDL